MEQLKGLNTKLGILNGRDAIYLDQIVFNTGNELTLSGEFNSGKEDVNFEMKFKGVVFLSTIELDFDKRGQMESLAIVEHSERINEFEKLDHSSKISDRHRHYYVRTYDTVFEIISSEFELVIET